MQQKVEKEDSTVFVCASLNGEIERQKTFSRNFNDHSKFRFVESVDGRKWSYSEADRHVSEEMRQLRERERLKGKLWINEAAIACALTHRDKLLAEAEKSDVVLCEDDILLSRDFIQLVLQKDVRKELSKLDSIVLFHYYSRTPLTASSAPVAEFGRFRVFELDEVHVVCGACYYAPPEVARRIREYQTPVRCAADHWLEMKKNGCFPSVYVLHPTPVRLAGMASNIGYGGEFTSNSLLMRLARRVKRVIGRRRQKFYDKLVVWR